MPIILPFGPGMGLIIDLGEMLVIKMRVDLGRTQIGVP